VVIEFIFMVTISPQLPSSLISRINAEWYKPRPKDRQTALVISNIRPGPDMRVSQVVNDLPHLLNFDNLPDSSYYVISKALVLLNHH